MRVGSLFSGIGGLDAGLARAGLEHAFLCEWDEWRRGVLAERFPGVPVYDDVRTVRAADVDLLCGGFPCQDLSVAGRRAGLQAGERSSLFFEFARCADELVQPGGYVLIENVPGLLSSQGGRDFALVLATLAELGFHDLAWRVLDSRYFGVPQRRRRVFVVGRRASGRRCCEVLLEPESGGGDPAAGGEAGAGVAFASLSGLGSGGPDDNDGQAGRVIVEHSSVTGQAVDLAPSLDTRGADGPRRNQDALLIADTLTSGSHPGSNMPGRRREDDTNIVAYAIRRDPGGTGQGHNTNYVTAFDWQSGGDVRLNISEAATSALTKQQTPAGQQGNAAVRRLTPIECERLQGLPDNWTLIPDNAPDSRRYAGLGDAVTANVGHWIGTRLLTVEARYA